MSFAAKASRLFQPLRVGDLTLSHRVVLAPLTRCRADEDFVHHELAAEYYAQRGSTPGTLLIAEATSVSFESTGNDHTPGIYNDAQIEGWNKVTDAVHAKGSYIFVQLWAQGRAATPSFMKELGLDVVAPSNVPLSGRAPPRVLTNAEIKGIVQDFTNAAKNAIRAGFDGVEIHGANGYLVDQFLQDSTNLRTDEYGGNIENRTRFAREIIDSVSAAIGESRLALRLSPWSRFQEMRMDDPIPTYTYLTKWLVDKHPNLAYLSLIESGIYGNTDLSSVTKHFASDVVQDSNDFIRKLWQPRPYITAGGYTSNLSKALQVAEEQDVLVAFGRSFISNPDLPERIRLGIPWTPYNRSTFYLRGPHQSHGYTDYPFATEQKGSS